MANHPCAGLHLVHPPAHRRKPLVLVAEHHEDTRQMLHTMLALEGFDVAESETGEAALTDATRLRPDVILLDGTLPAMDGLAVAKELRSRHPDRGQNIVFVSGYAERGLEHRVYAAGCDSFFVKPVDFTQLMSIVRRLAAPEPLAER